MSSSVALVAGRGLPLLRSIRLGAVASSRNITTDKVRSSIQQFATISILCTIITFVVQTKPPVVDEATHTGQQWSEDDVRNVRFMHRNKEVNRRWAIDLIKEVPPKVVHQRVVQCDGGGGALGHPRYVQQNCYCSRHFP